MTPSPKAPKLTRAGSASGHTPSPTFTTSNSILAASAATAATAASNSHFAVGDQMHRSATAGGAAPSSSTSTMEGGVNCNNSPYFPPLSPLRDISSAASFHSQGGAAARLMPEKSAERLMFKGSPMTLLAERSLGKINSSPSSTYANFNLHQGGHMTGLPLSSTMGGGGNSNLNHRSNLGLGLASHYSQNHQTAHPLTLTSPATSHRFGYDDILASGSDLMVLSQGSITGPSPMAGSRHGSFAGPFQVPLQKLDLSHNPIGK